MTDSEERDDPAATDNARAVTVIRMAQLRSAFSGIPNFRFRARPHVSHR
jgi:hypothetical protein